MIALGKYKCFSLFFSSLLLKVKIITIIIKNKISFKQQSHLSIWESMELIKGDHSQELQTRKHKLIRSVNVYTELGISQLGQVK